MGLKKNTLQLLLGAATLLTGFTGFANVAQAEYLGDDACSGVIQAYGDNDFFTTLYSPDIDAPRKPGTEVYAGDAVDVVKVTESGFTGISFPLQNGTIGYLPSQLVVPACGADIPEPERPLYPGIDLPLPSLMR